jgi:hypothetical protein
VHLPAARVGYHAESGVVSVWSAACNTACIYL